MRHFLLCASTALCLSAPMIIAAPAHAQSKKELAAQDAVLAQRITTLESRMLTGDPAAEQLMQRMDGLESSVRATTGELERLRYERDTLRAELAALSEDLREIQDLANRMKIHLDAVDLVAQEQSRISAPRTYGDTTGQAYSTDTNDSVSVGQPSQVPGAPVLKEQTIGVQQSYNDVEGLPQAGQQKLAEGDFTGAQTAFQQYLAARPDAGDAGEVNFWLGETYFVKGGYIDAADSYIAAMRLDPKGTKAPNAMVKLAATLRELGNVTESCQTLDSFPSQYPNAPSDVRDQARLERSRSGC